MIQARLLTVNPYPLADPLRSQVSSPGDCGMGVSNLLSR